MNFVARQCFPQQLCECVFLPAMSLNPSLPPTPDRDDGTSAPHWKAPFCCLLWAIRTSPPTPRHTHTCARKRDLGILSFWVTHCTCWGNKRTKTLARRELNPAVPDQQAAAPTFMSPECKMMKIKLSVNYLQNSLLNTCSESLSCSITLHFTSTTYSTLEVFCLFLLLLLLMAFWFPSIS